MRDPHPGIVHDDRKVVGRPAIGPHDDEVAEHVIGERDVTADEIGEGHIAKVRDPEAHGRGLAGLEPHARVAGRNVPTAAAVLRRQVRRQGGLSFDRQLLGRAEAVVGVTAREQVGRDLPIECETVSLPIRSERAADVRPFVPAEAKPPDVIEDGVLRRAGGTLRVGVLDAEHERATVPTREQPVEQRRARVADVQLARRTGREPDAEPTHRATTSTSTATACAAIASPRPTASTPSLVLPFTLTAAISRPSTLASRRRISSR